MSWETSVKANYVLTSSDFVLPSLFLIRELKHRRSWATGEVFLLTYFNANTSIMASQQTPKQDFFRLWQGAKNKPTKKNSQLLVNIHWLKNVCAQVPYCHVNYQRTSTRVRHLIKMLRNQQLSCSLHDSWLLVAQGHFDILFLSPPAAF